ncbi:MAG: NAD(P)H-hydrate dehydratase [Fimbriimonadaceae bacterium]
MWIASRFESQEIDRKSVLDFGLKESDLMEAAGAAVFRVVGEWIPTGKRLAVVCGKGNNGADGFVVAGLAHRGGYFVACIVGCSESELNEAARHQLSRLRNSGVQPVFCDAPLFFENLADTLDTDLIVDALLGTGAVGIIREPYTTLIQAMNEARAEVVAVDVPSGLDCDTGEMLGICVNASETVTFGLPKPFLFQGQGPEMVGVWSVADLGFPAELLDEPRAAQLLLPDRISRLLPKRGIASHKGNNGSLLIVAGSRDMRGAAVLCARAAIRAGIGLVTVASIEPVLTAVASMCPEATLLTLMEDSGCISASATETLLAAQSKYDAAVFGPGLTTSASVRNLLEQVWSKLTLPSVIDADALNLAALGVPFPTETCVLTPHPGEMARLLPNIRGTRFELARLANERFGKTVVLKGANSIIADPLTALSVNTTGNSGMSTAGMGDVLSGIIGTLLAQELSAVDAASVGVLWHGLAGDACSEKIGSIGFTAMEVADALPATRPQ